MSVAVASGREHGGAKLPRPMNRLYDKILGCIAGSQIGSALGQPAENMTRDELKKEFGVIDKLLGFELNGESHPPGTTEDGVERQKLIILAIRDKKGPPTCRDFAQTWLRVVKEESFGKLAGAQDEIHYRVIKAGIPPEESGQFDAHYGRTGWSRACHPIGIINAGHPELAARNALDVGRIYQPPTGRGILWKNDLKRLAPTYQIGLDWAAAVAAAVAAAFKPDATPDSMVEAALAYIVEPAREEIKKGLEIVKTARSYDEVCTRFDELYHATGMHFCMNRGYEVVTKGISLFYYFKGDVKQTMLAAANFGRDTDCLASVSAGLAGALSGVSNIPREWIEQVNAAAKVNKYTMMNLSLEEQAQLLYDCLMQWHAAQKAAVSAVDTLVAQAPASSAGRSVAPAPVR